MLIVLLTNRKDYESFLADVVFVFDGLENFGIISHRFHGLRGFFEKKWEKGCVNVWPFDRLRTGRILGCK